MPVQLPYTYPTLKTGTFQDLLSIVTRAYEGSILEENIVLPRKTPGQRAWLQAPFVALGACLAAAMQAAPADWALRLQDRMFAGLASPRSYAFDPENPALSRARLLAEDVERRTGRAPALLALISHPPVLGELAHLNFELVRHAALALRQIRGASCRPRFVVAVDAFALDSTANHEEGLYAGFMGRYHLGLDRMWLGRPVTSAWLLGQTAWSRMVHRFLRILGRGGEAGMVLAGGVPSTTRVLYAAREWVGDARRAGPLRARPQETLRLLRAHPDFVRFEADGPHGAAIRQNAARMAEAYVMSALAGVYGARDGKGAAASCLEAFGYPQEARAEALARLSSELERQTPYRARFFRLLHGRVLRRGRPIVLLPVVHRVDGGLGVEVRDAWAWLPAARGLEARSGDGQDWRGSPEEFARHFGDLNFQ